MWQIKKKNTDITRPGVRDIQLFLQNRDEKNQINPPWKEFTVKDSAWKDWIME